MHAYGIIVHPLDKHVALEEQHWPVSGEQGRDYSS